jgi:hypothetical protein
VVTLRRIYPKLSEMSLSAMSVIAPMNHGIFTVERFHVVSRHRGFKPHGCKESPGDEPMTRSTTKLYFAPFEEAVNEFLAAGGRTVTAIRTPRKYLDEFKVAFPAQTALELQYQDAPVQLVETQGIVSVRGKTSVGHVFEWPEPDMEWAAQDA